MAKARPKTADELRELVESLLLKMPEDQQRRFWSLITEHRDNWHHKQTISKIVGISTELAKTLMQGVTDFHGMLEEEHALLQKHRKPVQNAKRDAEIMKLNADGNTAGSIVLDMKERYPNLTDKMVNAVISRQRGKKPPAD